jgi:hypothetical protein
MEAIIPLFFAVLLALGVGALGNKRKIGFGWSFVLSIFLSPLIGLIITLCSKKKDTSNFVEVKK